MRFCFGRPSSVTRNAWHHREPFWYFLVKVIPVLWLPLTLLVPWLFVHWRDALRAFDLRIALLLSWIVLVVLFFSFSTGKRGVYVLPAVPALALLCAPYLAQVATRRGAQRAMFMLAAVASGSVRRLRGSISWCDRTDAPISSQRTASTRSGRSS